MSAITLDVAIAVPLEFHQGKLFENDAQAARWRHLPALIERLSNRLGEKTILRSQLWPDAQPEFACRYEPWLQRQAPCTLFPNDPAMALASRKALSRPLCLASQPVPIRVVCEAADGPPLRFEWQKRQHVVAHCWGPERIETGWWRGRDVRRDYYRIETTAGRRFWIFRTTASEAWFLHGIYG